MRWLFNKILWLIGIFGIGIAQLNGQKIFIYQGNPETGQYEFRENIYQSFEEPIKAILAYYGIRGLAPTSKYKESCLTEAVGLTQCSSSHYQFVKKWIDDEEITEDFSTCQISKLPAKSYYLKISIERKGDTVRVFYTSRLFQENKPSPWYLEGVGTFVLKGNDSKVEFLGEEEKIKKNETQ